MITVTLNEDKFAYDIHSLVKAFYPMQEVKVFVKGEKDLESDAGLPAFFVYFQEDAITLGTTDRHEEKKVELTQPQNGPVVKNQLKLALYGILSAITKKSLPWGTLTGIRPAGIALKLLEQGFDQEAVIAHMRRTYLASAAKATLAAEIAARERTLLAGLDFEKGYSLYIGIPFCPTTCLYCSFTSFPVGLRREKVAGYLLALEKEIEHAATLFEGRGPDSVYIGGGTPTTLESEELKRLFCLLQDRFDWSKVREFTLEAGRADSITAEKLRVMRAFGVDRISVNPQTMNQETLDRIGRRHTVEQVKQAFWAAREAGFENINMDLILGLPGERQAQVSHTLEQVEKLGPDSLTVHSLAVKRASRLAQWTERMEDGALYNTQEIMELAADSARRMGMHPYYLYRQKNMSGNLENVGYAKLGKECLYNVLIMEEKQSILALGAGTITKAVYGDGRIERCDNVKDVDLYIEKIDEMNGRKRRLFGK